MSLLLLPNTAGSAASSVSVSNGSSASSYDPENIITGSRARMWRSTATSGNVRIGYLLDEDVTVDHVVIARADKLVTENGLRVRISDRDSGGSWSELVSPDFNTLDSSDLIGKYSQDLVAAVSPGNERGYAIFSSVSSGTEAVQFAKFYASLAFDMGVDPILQSPPSWRDTPVRARPLKGWFSCETEQEISITWNGVTAAKAAAFEAIPRLLSWPFFLYESDASNIRCFEHRLEHVIIAEPYTVERLNNGYRNISVTFRRLTHWEVF